MASDLSTAQKGEMLSNARGLSKFFAVDIVIKIFGVTIWEYHFPPKYS